MLNQSKLASMSTWLLLKLLLSRLFWTKDSAYVSVVRTSSVVHSLNDTQFWTINKKCAHTDLFWTCCLKRNALLTDSPLWTHISPNTVCSASNTDTRLPTRTALRFGKPNSVISRTERRSLLIIICPAVKPSGMSKRVSSFSFLTEWMDKDRNTRQDVWKDTSKLAMMTCNKLSLLRARDSEDKAERSTGRLWTARSLRTTSTHSEDKCIVSSESLSSLSLLRSSLDISQSALLPIFSKINTTLGSEC